MTDVLICHSPDNLASARLLSDAIAREGYEAALRDAPSEAITGEIAEAKAMIVLWSEAAAASEWIRAEANVARGLKKLVQVSADGRPPPVPFDRAEMVSILTWKGEEDHPAWRSIQSALVALCGPAPERAMPAASVAEPEPAPAPAPAPEPAPVAAPRGGPNPLMIVLVVGLVLVALAAGAWYWLEGRGPAAVAETDQAAPPAPSEGPQIVVPEPQAPAPAPAPPQEAPPAPPPAAFDREAVVRDPSGAAILRNAPSSIGLAMERLASGDRVATYAQDGAWWQVRTASGRTGYLPAASLGPASAAPAPPPPVRTAEAPRRTRTERRTPPPPQRRSRIRKENAEVMVQFCDGAGRGTPQCRRFRREAGY